MQPRFHGHSFIALLGLMLVFLAISACSDDSASVPDGDATDGDAGDGDWDGDREGSISDGDADGSDSDGDDVDGDNDGDGVDRDELDGDLEPPFDPTGYVDPFIGTSGDHGQLSPAANVPFGMVRLGPDVMLGNHAGYDYQVDLTVGFSHTRIDGVGCAGAGGDIRILPSLGDEVSKVQSMHKATEIAEPGYYAVDLGEDDVIRAELTVSPHAGLHRYVFPAGSTPHLFIDLNSSFAGRTDLEWTVNSRTQEISGSLSGRTVCNEGRYTLYFSIRFSRPFESLEKIESLTGGDNAFITFPAGTDDPLLVKVGLSSLEIGAARDDSDAEIPGWDFEAVRASAREAWREKLATVEIEADAELGTLFYTMLYRTLLTPADITTQNDYYRGSDGKPHDAAGYTHYHGWSLWDSYRNKFALIGLLLPQQSHDMAQSLVNMCIQGRSDWATDAEPYPTVRTEHAGAVILDALEKGATLDDLDDAFFEIIEQLIDFPAGSPDSILERSYDYWVISELAARLGHAEIAATYRERAAQYDTTWTAHFLDMGDDADIMHARGLYEGTLWQYRWAVVHDIPGMIALDGGRAAFLAKLNTYFDDELHNHANEPDIHAPFLFDYVGAPWRTQDIVRRILTEDINQWYGTHEKWDDPYHGRIYRTEPEGMIPEMDDDDGTMAAWFVLASLGIYPVTVGQPIYSLTAPLFESATLHLAGGDFTIRAPGVSATNRYIQSATLNGEPLNRAWLRHAEIAGGGELRFEMGPEPNKDWASGDDATPPSAL